MYTDVETYSEENRDFGIIFGAGVLLVVVVGLAALTCLCRYLQTHGGWRRRRRLARPKIRTRSKHPPKAGSNVKDPLPPSRKTSKAASLTTNSQPGVKNQPAHSLQNPPLNLNPIEFKAPLPPYPPQQYQPYSVTVSPAGISKDNVSSRRVISIPSAPPPTPPGGAAPPKYPRYGASLPVAPPYPVAPSDFGSQQGPYMPQPPFMGWYAPYPPQADAAPTPSPRDREPLLPADAVRARPPAAAVGYQVWKPLRRSST